MTQPQIKWISREDPPEAFPPISNALRSPNGLLAAGGDLAAERLLYAYEHAVFPWFDTGQPILWWSPDPRCVLSPTDVHVSRRLRRTVRTSAFRVSFNHAFERVINACGRDRNPHAGTWITPGMIHAYTHLHQLGWAHSVEVWLGRRLSGGIYGVAIGRAFFGESMFSAVTGGSKVALLALSRLLGRHQFGVLDCQVPSPHLLRMGARAMPRIEFAALLQILCTPRTPFTDWPDAPIDATELLEH